VKERGTMSCSPNLLKILGIRLAKEITKTDLSAEERIFQAILVQALEDALTTSAFKKETYWKHDAHKWFLSNCEDFKNVCWSANMDPEFIRGEYLKLIKDKKIKFTKMQNGWINYRELYKLHRAAQSKEERREIKALIVKLKFN
jgi:hypothetical protein